MADGRRFMNIETGDVHECFDRCDAREDFGDRVVCPITHAVLGMSDVIRPPPRKRVKDAEDETASQVDRDRESRRRVGHEVLNEVFRDSGISDMKKSEYVDRAIELHNWLCDNTSGHKRPSYPFDAMMYATLMCASEGVHTPAVSIERDVEIARHVRPLRYVGKLGIKQNAVTKAYSAIMKKKA